MVLPYGPAYPVSPLIRGLRWAFLIAGIFYGRVKQRIYEIQEAKWREEEAERKIYRDKQLAILKARIAREERETVRLLESGKLFEEDDIDPKTGKTKQSKQAKKKCKKCDCDTCECKNKNK